MKEAEEKNVSRVRGLKVAFLAIVYTVLIFATLWLAFQGLYSNQDLIFWVWAVAAAMFSLITYTFLAMVFDREWLFATINLLSLIFYVAIYPRDMYVLAGGALFFLLMVLFQHRIRAESKNQLNFSLRRVMNGSLVAASYALLLLVGFNLYYHINQDLKQHPDRFYETMTSAITGSIPFVSENLAAGTNLNQSLDEYLMVKAEPELSANPGVTPNERSSFLNIYREQFLKQFGISASGDETLKAVIDKIVAAKVEQASAKYSAYLPLIFALLVIAALRLFMFVFNLVTMLVGYIILQLLILARFFHIGKASIEVKRLDI